MPATLPVSDLSASKLGVGDLCWGLNAGTGCNCSLIEVATFFNLVSGDVSLSDDDDDSVNCCSSDSATKLFLSRRCLCFFSALILSGLSLLCAGLSSALLPAGLGVPKSLPVGIATPLLTTGSALTPLASATL